MVTSTFVIRDPDTEEASLIGTVQRDISDRKAAEQELRRFSSLVEASGDFIAIAGHRRPGAVRQPGRPRAGRAGRRTPT